MPETLVFAAWLGGGAMGKVGRDPRYLMAPALEML